MPHAFLADTGITERRLVAGPPIGIGARVDRIAEHVVDGGVAGFHPADLAALMHPREAQALGTEPQPYPPGRTGLGETCEDSGDRGANRFVRMKADLAFSLAPNETDRQAAAKFTAGRLVANASVQPGAQEVEFSLTHGAL